ncbi:MAG TPA: FeoA family protein [Gemmatimonadaceae bacterium]|nr:FeoA family protein [Gemmatimonadaceae bacterium]
MLKLLSRRRAPSALPVLDVAPASAAAADLSTAAPAARRACALSACLAGSRATVLEVGCGDAEACRLRALGLCEGASVDVVRARGCTLLEVRGARLAVGSAIAAGITVLPVG